MEKIRKVFMSFSGMVQSIVDYTSTIEDIDNGFIFPACSEQLLDDPTRDPVLKDVDPDILDVVVAHTRKAVEERRCLFYRWNRGEQVVPGWITTRLDVLLPDWSQNVNTTGAVWDTDVLIGLINETWVADLLGNVRHWDEWPEELYRHERTEIELWRSDKMTGLQEYRDRKVAEAEAFDAKCHFGHKFEVGVGTMTFTYVGEEHVETLAVEYHALREPDFSHQHFDGMEVDFCGDAATVINGAPVVFTKATRYVGMHHEEVDVVAVALMLRSHNTDTIYNWMHAYPLGVD